MPLPPPPPPIFNSMPLYVSFYPFLCPRALPPPPHTHTHTSPSLSLSLSLSPSLLPYVLFRSPCLSDRISPQLSPASSCLDLPLYAFFRHGQANLALIFKKKKKKERKKKRKKKRKTTAIKRNKLSKGASNNTM